MKLTPLTLVAALLLSSVGPALALTVQRSNQRAENGTYQPVAIVADGPGAGIYHIGENGLTAEILYNPALLAAWVGSATGADVTTVQVIPAVDPPSDDPVQTANVKDCSNDKCTEEEFISYCDANPSSDHCNGKALPILCTDQSTGCEIPPTACDSQDQLLCPIN